MGAIPAGMASAGKRLSILKGGINELSYRRSLKELDPITRQSLEHGDWWATALGTMFSRENFEIIEATDLPTLLAPKVVRFWDYAGTEVSKDAKDPDWTAGTLMLWDQGVAYVIDVTRFREEVVKGFLLNGIHMDRTGIAIGDCVEFTIIYPAVVTITQFTFF